ncbi:acyl-CoA dehydrogenase family protein [Kibdelosporangium persicum]|uniref:Glutaryl-CoA dehydrogenase n=1 Tax=Kibdelosporangium persicum TaxID=2698649 RepID=A0ABX2FIV1_9PSEU|nr:acyl-CoA dehydrogenase family protein [Kibdelosporangium persicum]NRN71349.1 Glutaryl-CoA dehydrogenase [Kibdelosporangium persicum]
MPDQLTDLVRFAGDLVGGRAGDWDAAGEIPRESITAAAAAGVLCAQVPTEYGGLGLTSTGNGRLTAHVGSLCSSLRSLMTSQGMAAWSIQRLGSRGQRRAYLPRLTGGELAAVAFSEASAGSDLSLIDTEIVADGDSVVLSGRKVWTTGAWYADLLVVFGQYAGGAAAVVVPTATPGVTVDRVPDPLGCRAAGHATVTFDSVRLPAGAVLGGAGQSVELLVTTALTYGRLSVAWGCVGILRGCLHVVTAHAKVREQFGKPLARHQLVARHIAGLAVDEHTAAAAAEHASRCWDERSPDMVVAAVRAKYLASTQAARGAGTAVQVLASAGARDGDFAARAYRDAKLMEIIEGSTEICQLILAEHALTTSA